MYIKIVEKNIILQFNNLILISDYLGAGDLFDETEPIIKLKSKLKKSKRYLVTFS